MHGSGGRNLRPNMVSRAITLHPPSVRQGALLRVALVGLAALALGTMATPARAASPYAPETYSRLNLSLGGNFFAGNLNQLQANLQGTYGLSSPTKGVDVGFNAYRLWGKPTPNHAFKVLGDDAYVTALPFWYFVKRAYLIGLASYDSSQIQKLDRRITLGTGVGYAPVRSKTLLVRAAVVSAFEYSQRNEDELGLGQHNDHGMRMVGRFGLMTNGWLRTTEGPVSFRYIAMALPNAGNVRDLRFSLDAQLDVKIAEPLSFRVTQIFQYDAATVRSREPYDIRATLGFVWTKK